MVLKMLIKVQSKYFVCVYGRENLFDVAFIVQGK